MIHPGALWRWSILKDCSFNLKSPLFKYFQNVRKDTEWRQQDGGVGTPRSSLPYKHTDWATIHRPTPFVRNPETNWKTPVPWMNAEPESPKLERDLRHPLTRVPASGPEPYDHKMAPSSLLLPQKKKGWFAYRHPNFSKGALTSSPV